MFNNRERTIEKLRNEVLDRAGFEVEPTDEYIDGTLDEVILSDSSLRYMSAAEKRSIKQELYNSLRGMDILEELLADPEITEIMVNGPDAVFVEKNGVISLSDVCFESSERLENLIQRIVGGCNRVVNSTMPIADARLPGGERVNIAIAPVALNGPIVTIRRFSDKPVTLEKLVEWNSLTYEAASFLAELIKDKYSIFISGGTGTGKTTFLNALSEKIPTSERIITIEDSAELRLIGHKNLVSLEARNSNMSGSPEITIRDLIKASLRMRPDRIIVGEVRGKEAFDMLQVMNTGHEGSMCTGHANSCSDCITRLENMVLMAVDIPLPAIRQQITGGLDIIIQLARLPDGRRVVSEITEVAGMNKGEVVLNQLYAYRKIETGKGACSGVLSKVGNLSKRKHTA